MVEFQKPIAFKGFTVSIDTKNPYSSKNISDTQMHITVLKNITNLFCLNYEK